MDLARAGVDVTVVEKEAAAGGKMRVLNVDGAAIDAGPTVFTMRWVFDQLFDHAGARLSDHLTLKPAEVLARHAWSHNERLDLFADIERSADAIAAFAGPREARGYRALCARSADIYRTLLGPFMTAQRPSPLSLAHRVGWTRLSALWRTTPFRSVWSALGEHFQDKRVRQLFARYATYVGSSPFAAPATLMLITHVEQEGVWLVEGGMGRVAQALQSLAESQGARFQFGVGVSQVRVERGRAVGVALDNGAQLDADAVVFNGDPAALGAGVLGAQAHRAAPATPRRARSLSAVTWCVNARTSGFPLKRHSVFFGDDYPGEFDAVFRQRTTPARPTVYVCAQARDAGAQEATPPASAEPLLVLVNAPADGDLGFAADEHAARAALTRMADCGLELEGGPTALSSGTMTDPARFNALFPATGGALYGRANHGPFASFSRPGAASKLPRLYLAGGGVHPGAGVPMATLSGRLAAERVLADLSARTARSVS